MNDNFHIYMLLTNTNSRNITYVGYTNNLKKRLNKHNLSIGAKFTKGRKWTLIYSKSFKNKSSALKEEYKLKKNYILRNKIKLKYLINKKIVY